MSDPNEEQRSAFVSADADFSLMLLSEPYEYLDDLWWASSKMQESSLGMNKEDYGTRCGMVWAAMCAKDPSSSESDRAQCAQILEQPPKGSQTTTSSLSVPATGQGGSDEPTEASETSPEVGTGRAT